ncbi:hypothetical protein BaRGS_00036840 [Batillaria attramentaria]|uniref:Uncharacterized protein n=1 Tax=Batillaria attramentaria TaxID=370345 RepID=A0ABD0JAE9_9CAEN
MGAQKTFVHFPDNGRVVDDDRAMVDDDRTIDVGHVADDGRMKDDSRVVVCQPRNTIMLSPKWPQAKTTNVSGTHFSNTNTVLYSLA